MKFAYEPVSYAGYLALEPRAPVVFTNPANGKSLAVKALVDSGAGRSVLHPELAEFFGVALSRLETLPISSANNETVGYEYDLKVHLKGDARHEYLIPCAFFPGLKTDAVLGREVFFDRYRIVFEEYRYQFQVTPRV
jgi:gag-polyprotein putative aspartyl protease